MREVEWHDWASAEADPEAAYLGSAARREVVAEEERTFRRPTHVWRLAVAMDSLAALASRVCLAYTAPAAHSASRRQRYALVDEQTSDRAPNLLQDTPKAHLPVVEAASRSECSREAHSRRWAR